MYLFKLVSVTNLVKSAEYPHKNRKFDKRQTGTARPSSARKVLKYPQKVDLHSEKHYICMEESYSPAAGLYGLQMQTVQSVYTNHTVWLPDCNNRRII